MVAMVSTMDLIASRAISWPLRTMERNWSWSSCWVLVVALAIVFASCWLLLLTLPSSAWHVKQSCLIYFADADAGASVGPGGLRRGPGSGRLRGALGGRGLGRGGLGGRGLRCRALARGGLGGRGGVRRGRVRGSGVLGCGGWRPGGWGRGGGGPWGPGGSAPLFAPGGPCHRRRAGA